MVIDQITSLEERKKRLKKIKRKRNRLYIISGVIIAIIITSAFWGIKALSTSLATSDDIKEMIIGENIYFDNKNIELTSENISSVEIINRTTVKNKEDNINVRIKVINKSKSINFYSNIKLEYIDDVWALKEINLGNITNIEVSSNYEHIIINELKNNGFKTIDGNKYSSSIIRKVDNLKLSSSGEDSSLFTAEVEISNGACYQKCNISGKVIYDDETETLDINNVYLQGEEKIYKENNIDEVQIKSIILEEVANDHIYSFNDGGKNIYYKINKKNITNFIVKKYTIKEDYTIRAEIEATSQQENGDIIFLSGFVSISGEPYYGDAKNSRDIIVEKIKKGVQ